MARPRRPPTFPEIGPRPRHEKYAIPAEFRPAWTSPPGRYRLLEVFAGLERTVPFRKYPGDDSAIRKTADRTWAQVVDGPGWMYVAPRRTPPEARRGGFKMVESPDDVIVVARGHLANSPRMYVYLDIIHEFLHILQRRQGRELWPGVKVAYVDRPTEIEAYAYSVVEARRLGVTDSYLREYIDVPWVARADYHRLLDYLGIDRPPKRRRAKYRAS